MALCNSLNNNISACASSVGGPGGVEDGIYIVAKQDIDQAALLAAYDTINKVKLTNLPLLSGKKMYYIGGLRNSFVPSSTLSIVGKFTQELHSIEMTVFDSNVATKWLVELMKNGKFVVVYRNNDGEFEVLGLGAGLLMTTKTYTPVSAESRRGVKLTLASSSDQQEPYAPATLLITDQVVTLAYLESKVFVAA